jgi:hypothetical protein
MIDRLADGISSSSKFHAEASGERFFHNGSAETAEFSLHVPSLCEVPRSLSE